VSALVFFFGRLFGVNFPADFLLLLFFDFSRRTGDLSLVVEMFGFGEGLFWLSEGGLFDETETTGSAGDMVEQWSSSCERLKHRHEIDK